MSSKTCFIFFLILTMVAGAELAWLGKQLSQGEEAIRVRNSLLVTQGEGNIISWSPQQVPASFTWEQLPPPQFFKQTISNIKLDDSSVLNSALAIAHHLRQTKGSETSIKDNSIHTYKAIVNTGRGYCADYTQVFIALAHAANIAVREWGFATKNYGGGHAFVEVWEPTLNQWVFLDPFASFYLLDKKSHLPLSANQFNQLLLSNQLDSFELVIIHEGRFGFRNTRQALDFYLSGANEFYLWWSNAIFSYENNAIVAYMGSFSRHLEQLSAIAIGIHPKIMLLPNHNNQQAINFILQLRKTTLVCLLTLPVFALLSLIFLYSGVKKKRREQRKPTVS